MTRKEVRPITNPKKPIKADMFCTSCLSRNVVNLLFILWRNDINGKDTRNNTENNRATAMNAGVEAVGADKRRFGVFLGRADKSYTGLAVGEVQLIFAALLLLAHEPSGPRKILGPSMLFELSLELQGVTVRRATLSWSNKVGAKKANKESIVAVSARTGARYKLMAFERPAIIVSKNR